MVEYEFFTLPVDITENIESVCIPEVEVNITHEHHQRLLSINPLAPSDCHRIDLYCKVPVILALQDDDM